MRIHYLILAMAAAALSLYASGITLTFEGLQDSENIADYYNGGVGGFGSGPGASYGVTFSGDATAYIQTLIRDGSGGYNSGGSGLFGGEPSVYTAMLFCSQCNAGNTAETIDVAGGFNSGFSFYYSAPLADGQLDIWSGPDGTGTDLATLALPATSAYDASGDSNCDEYGDASDPGAIACPFVPLSVSFAGTAGSVVFTGATDNMYFDNIAFDSLGQAVPEPTAWLLAAAGLLVIAFYRRVIN